MRPLTCILMTADTVGGVWTYALELTRALAEDGVRVELATMGRPLSAAQCAEASALDNLRVHESGYRLEWMDDPWEDVARAGEWLLKLERQIAPDIVHLNGYVHAALPWRAPCLAVAHSCVLSWWAAVRGEAAPAHWARYQTEVSAGLRAADRVVAPTAAMAAAVQRHYGPLPAIQVIANGRDARLFRPAAKRDLILTAGRLWDEAKNIALLEQAASGLDWPIYVAGDQRHPAGGEVAPQSLRPLGRLSPPELAQWYGAAAIYALPARYEPFGLSALEAARSGCARVLGDIASLREVWGSAARYVPPDDPPALRAALQALIRDEGCRRQLAERARARARAYSPRRMADAYRAAYQTLSKRVA